MYLSGTDVYVTGTITNSVTMLPELFIAKYNSSGAQQFFTTYSNGYGDLGKDIIINGTTGYIVVTGASYNSSFDSDVSIVAFNSSGVQQWASFYNHANLNDGGFKITTKNAFVTVIAPITISTNNYKLASITYSASNGVQSGSVTTGATATSSVEIVTDLVTDGSGNMYLCGATQQNAGQGYDMYVAKITTSLTISWEQTINGYSGSSSDDFARGIKVDASSNVYVTGVTTHSTQGKNITTVKLNSSGVVQWTKNINSAFNGNDAANDLAIDASANVYVTGYQTIGTGNTDIYSTKLDNSTGNIIWEKFEVNDLLDEGTNLILDNNDVIVAGSREVTTGNYEYVTYKYVQKDVITPTDFNGEIPNATRLYYPNKGQLKNTGDTLVPEIKFYTNNTYPRFYFKNTIQSYVFSHIDTVAATNDTIQRIDLKFTNSSESSKIYPLEEQHQDYLNYFLAHTPSEGVTNVFGNQKLIVSNLYTNIDLMCSSNDKGIKYYFIVKPGGDMRDIKWEFSGATSYSLNGSSNFLSINSLIGSITFDKPIAYQLTSANATVAVTSFSPSWTVDGSSNKYKFNDGAYTSSLTLVIEVDQGNGTNSAAANNDMDWSTFYGSSGNNTDNFNSISSDKNGNINICGVTSSNNFPLLGANTQPSAGQEDAVVLRFNKNGVRRWATCYGGGSNDGASSGVFDTLSNYYMTGKALALVAFPSTQPIGAFVDNTYNGNTDFYIAKFDTLGKLRWATLYGAGGDDNSSKINIDGNGNLFVVGSVNYGAFPLVPKINAFNSTKGISFIMKFTPTLQLDWVTRYGYKTTSPYYGFINSIAFDDVNDVYITGSASDSLRPKFLAGASNDTTYNGSAGNPDAFLTVFNSNTDTIVWSTFIGGSGMDVGRELKFVKGNMYLTGGSSSTDFPLKHSLNQYFDTITSYTNFIMKFSTITKKLKWSTGFGSGVEIYDLTGDKNNNIVMVGLSASSLPTKQHTGSFWQPSNNGSYDSFISIFNPSDSLIYSTYVGGELYDTYSEVTAYNNYIYCTGSSKSGLAATTPFPLANLGGSPAAWWQPDINTTFGYGNGTGIITRFNFTSTLYVGIEELVNSNNNNSLVSVYPNPSSETLYLKFKTNINEKILVEVYDILGRNMYLKSFNYITENQVEQLDLSNYTNGMYVIKISSTKQQECIKIIKEH